MKKEYYELKTDTNVYKYSESDKIGEGVFGTVYKAKNKDKKYVAIKKIARNKYFTDIMIEQEISFMTPSTHGVDIDHYNLLYLLEYVKEPDSYTIIMPYYKLGSLSNNMNFQTEIEVMEAFRQICYGLNNLHKAGIVHRDLKCDNILVSKVNAKQNNNYDKYYAIGDFGISKKVNCVSKVNSTKVGTTITRAPEVSSGLYGTQADIYSLGCVLYNMISGEDAFSRKLTYQAIEKRKEQHSITITSRVGDISDFTLQILEGCLQYNPNDRFTMAMLEERLELKNLYTDYISISSYIAKKQAPVFGAYTITMKKEEKKDKGLCDSEAKTIADYVNSDEACKSTEFIYQIKRCIIVSKATINDFLSALDSEYKIKYDTPDTPAIQQKWMLPVITDTNTKQCNPVYLSGFLILMCIRNQSANSFYDAVCKVCSSLPEKTEIHICSTDWKATVLKYICDAIKNITNCDLYTHTKLEHLKNYCERNDAELMEMAYGYIHEELYNSNRKTTYDNGVIKVTFEIKGATKCEEYSIASVHS